MEKKPLSRCGFIQIIAPLMFFRDWKEKMEQNKQAYFCLILNSKFEIIS